MKLMIIACGAALALAGCNSNKGNDVTNAGATDANMTDMNATDPNAANMMMTENNSAMANGAGGADMNTATNAATENKMEKDLKTHDKDTNLKNGM